MEKTVKIMSGITALLVDDKDGLKRGHLFVGDVCIDTIFAETEEEVLEDFRDLVTAVGTKELFAAADYMQERGCGLDFAVGCGNPDNFEYIMDVFMENKKNHLAVKFV